MKSQQLQSRFFYFAYIIVLLLTILLLGCNSTQEVSVPPTKIALTLSPTLTGAIEESTISESTTQAINTITRVAGIPIESCQFEVQDGLGGRQLNYFLSYLQEGGDLLISDRSGIFNSWLTFPLEGNATFNSLSPDGEWLVFRQNKEIIVMHTKNGRRITFPSQDEWTEIWGWVSPTKIAIREARVRDTDLFIVLSPFADPVSIEKLELPWQFIPEFSNPVNYSPNFTLILYLEEISMAVAKLDTSEIIWKQPMRTAIAKLGLGSAWSPDSSSVAVALPIQPEVNELRNELAIFNMNGQLIFQTNYHETYESYTVDGIKWSPDGQYISFWLVIPDATTRLQIYDTFAEEFLGVCIVNDSIGDFKWSLDGKQFAYITNLNHLVIYDLPSQQAFLLAKDVLRLTGWVNLSGNDN